MLPSCFFCPITASVFSPLSVTTIRLLPPSSFVLLVLEQNKLRSFLRLAVRTGLEPATPGVTGRYSNQLNYRTNCSVLCVFLERGCKGTHFFIICKFFRTFLVKKCKKSGGEPVLDLPPGVLEIVKCMKLNMFA